MNPVTQENQRKAPRQQTFYAAFAFTEVQNEWFRHEVKVFDQSTGGIRIRSLRPLKATTIFIQLDPTNPCLARCTTRRDMAVARNCWEYGLELHELVEMQQVLPPAVIEMYIKRKQSAAKSEIAAAKNQQEPAGPNPTTQLDDLLTKALGITATSLDKSPKVAAASPAAEPQPIPNPAPTQAPAVASQKPAVTAVAEAPAPTASPVTPPVAPAAAEVAPKNTVAVPTNTSAPNQPAHKTPTPGVTTAPTRVVIPKVKAQPPKPAAPPQQTGLAEPVSEAVKKSQATRQAQPQPAVVTPPVIVPAKQAVPARPQADPIQQPQAAPPAAAQPQQAAPVSQETMPAAPNQPQQPAPVSQQPSPELQSPPAHPMEQGSYAPQALPVGQPQLLPPMPQRGSKLASIVQAIVEMCLSVARKVVGVFRIVVGNSVQPGSVFSNKSEEQHRLDWLQACSIATEQPRSDLNWEDESQ